MGSRESTLCLLTNEDFKLGIFFPQKKSYYQRYILSKCPIYMAGQIPYYQMSALHIPVTDPLVLGSPVVYLIP